MKRLFSHWDRISTRIQKSSKIYIFFDYDGTLTPIVSTPEEAKIPQTVKNLIKKLLNIPKVNVAIVSGRSLANIKRMVGLNGILYVGNHGLEIDGKGFKLAASSVKEVFHALKLIMKHIDGAIIEDKDVTFSVHTRLVRPRERTFIRKEFKKITAPYIQSKKIRISHGKEVLEVRPNLDWNKGDAVKYLLGKKNALPIYLGDDITDIDAFSAIKGKGISIYVGSPKRKIPADYFLRGPEEVKIFIKNLVELFK